MIYKIADFRFAFPGAPKALTDYCAAYAAEGEEYDTEISVSDADIQAEINLYERNAEDNRAVTPGFVRWQCMLLAYYRKICAYALQKDAFLMHGVAIEYAGEGYIFTAQSGTGKTTHVQQWKNAFGETQVTIVNGDKPIIRFIDGKVYAYGTPWNGKEKFGTTGRTEVKALCFVERGEVNKICSLSDTEVVPRLFSQIMVVDSTDLAKQLELVDAFLEKVRCYRLQCTISPEAAEVAYRGMQG